MACNDRGCVMEHELADHCDEDVDSESEVVGLPVVPLVALAGSGTFAAWMSLTCFVC